MMILDVDSKEARQFKEQLKYLTDEERTLLFSLPENEQNALLTMKNPFNAWNARYAAGKKLTDEVLQIAKHSYEFDPERSVPGVILRERGR